MPTSWSSRAASRWRPSPTDFPVQGVDVSEETGPIEWWTAKKAGIEAVVFDRGGNKYHGRVAAVADGAREAGLTF